MGKVIKELPYLRGQVEFVCVPLLAVAIGFCVSSCSVTEFTGTDFEDGANENIAVQDTPEEQDPDNDTIPYDPNAPDYVVHELRPVEVDFQMRSKYIKEHPILGNDPIPIIKWIRQEDRVKYLHKCMRSKGINVRMNEGGLSYGFVVDDAEVERNDKAFHWCMVAYPSIEVTVRPLNREQAQLLYRYYVETVIPCLTKMGYKGPYNVPSEEKFVSEADKFPRYSPYPQVVPEEKYFEVIKTCPVRPGYEQIWGRY